MSNLRSLSKLEAQLREAGARDIQRRQRRRKIVAASCTVSIALAALAFVENRPSSILQFGSDRPSSAYAAVNVRSEGEDLVVTIRDLEARPESVEASIRAAGVSMKLTAVPVGPSLAGRFLAYEGSANAPGLEPLEVDGSTFEGFRVPRNSTERLELRIGRKARAGETYSSPSDAYDAGEPLHCSRVWGQPAKSVMNDLATLDLSIRWQLFDGTEMQTISSPSGTPNSYVTDAIAVDPSTIVIYLNSTPVSPFFVPVSDPENANC